MRTKWLIFALLFGLLGAHVYNILTGNRKAEVIEIEKTDTVVINDTITQRDTIKITKTKQVYREIVKIDTLFKENGDTVKLFTENKQYNDTLWNDQNDSLIIQSNISGINPKLDSISVDWRRHEIIKTVTITNTVKKKGLHIGPSISTGYDIINKKWGVMAGISLSLDI